MQGGGGGGGQTLLDQETDFVFCCKSSQVLHRK